VHGQPQLTHSQVATVSHATWGITELHPQPQYVCSPLNIYEQTATTYYYIFQKLKKSRKIMQFQLYLYILKSSGKW